MTLDRFIKLLKLSILGVFLMAEVYVVYRWYDARYAKSASASKHYKLTIEGAITVEMSQRIMKKIEALMRKGEIDSLLLVFDTPGGSPVASDNLYYFFKGLQERIPVTYYVNSSAASGGYYIASGAEKLYANANAIVGSVGVIMQGINVSELAEKWGIRDETLTAGAYKQMISPLKPTSEESIAYFKENILGPTYANFSSIVALERNITKGEEDSYFQGRVFIAGDPRIRGKLVDEIISYPEIVALEKARHNTDTLRELEYKEKYGSWLQMGAEALFKVAEERMGASIR
ncbi:MAG: S49 family peptidase [Campylobacterales bacterium]|nr:S49 family peptidase [Campylobacterales bacterium]HEO99744.1 S49 family peptidase [Campylobacterota bacterium]